MRCERGRRGRGNDVSHVFFFVLSNWDDALPGLGALRKQHTLHISIVNIAQTRPQRKGTLSSDLKGAGARAEPGPAGAILPDLGPDSQPKENQHYDLSEKIQIPGNTAHIYIRH